MFDTVLFRLTKDKVGKVDFIEETPSFLNGSTVAFHDYQGEVVVTGYLGGLKVIMSRYQIKIKGGSLCKWHLGDNYKSMSRGEVKRAIERLSDELHLPVDKATITRLDVAENFITRYPVETYLNHLGVLSRHKRLIEPTGLYYIGGGGRLCFYDKNKEQRANKEPIPQLCQGRNVMRFEQRYMGGLAKQFKVADFTASMLYDEQTYIMLLDLWKQAYFDIKKINDVTLNFKSMTTKKDFYKMGALSLIEQMGGEVELLTQISDAQKRGELTKKQAYDLRQAIADVGKEKKGLTTQSDAITELNQKIADAVRFYR